MLVELHCHSTCSDGALSPVEVAARAAARGVALFALTDHDTCAGSAAAVVPGAEVVRAVEISCDDGAGTVHVLAYDAGGAWDLLEARLADVRIARRNRLTVMAARLRMRGIVVDVGPLLARADGRAVGRPDLARLMVEAGVVGSVKEAFSRHLYDRGPVDVPHQTLSLVDVLALGRAAGARMSLAHPHLYGARAEPLLRRHRGEGLEGVEACYGPYDAGERRRWRALAAALDLVVTGGSDFHAPGDPEPGVELSAAEGARLSAWLGRAA
ncbi:MAG: PHP domain-containing protein [Kofleriaceae bacterium]